MERKDIETGVKEVTSERLNKEIETLTLTDNFTEDLGADSLDIVDLIQALEERFQISISDEDAQNLKTIGAVADYLEKLLE